MAITRDVGLAKAARPRIDVSGGDLHRWVDEAWRALVEANDEGHPDVLVRGNELVRMTERGELEPYTLDSLRDALSRVAQFGHYDGHNEWVAKPPRPDVATNLLARDSGDYVGAPRVERVVDVPVLAADGGLVTRPGHHPTSRLFYRPAPGLEDVTPSEVESVDDLTSARDLLLDELLGDFAFADDASRANALALLLLPFVREFIGDDPTPMHVILAPEPGTGKTLLAQAALSPGCGLVPVMAGRDNGEEMRKTLTATLLSGTRAIIFDNLHGTLDSAPLASALTTGTWHDRVLGHSRQVVLPVRNAWVATGNNLDLTDEHARRAVPIFLEPGAVRPADRPKTAFRHPNLLQWAREHRAELVSAALTLVRHWHEGEALLEPAGTFARDPHGPRTSSERTLGSFEQWAEVIGGILRAADVPGFLDNRDRLLLEANDERQEAAEFLAAWHALDVQPMTINEVVKSCLWGGSLHDHLPVELAAAAGREDHLHTKLT